jgi:hypothetical protein
VADLNAVRSRAARVLAPLRRRVRTPFRPDAGRPLLVHCAHHKVGTTWFHRVLRAVASEYGLRYERFGPGVTIGESIGVAFFEQGREFRRHAIGARPFRGSHLVRDPRDVVVSAYAYHLWTTEPWARAPKPEYGGRSYQELLTTLDRDEGLLLEIERSAATVLADMAAWDYAQPEFVELRYEELIADEPTGFRRMFRGYGFDDAAVERSVEIADGFSFRNVTGRGLGEGESGSHLRSGRPGEWREWFGARHRERSAELAGEVLVRLGYEDDDGWVLATGAL